MSACNILVQPLRKAVHMMVDGVSYDKSGVIQEVTQKCIALPTLNAAVTVMGPVLGALVMAAELQKRFATFDELVDGIEAVMPDLFNANLSVLSGSGIPDTRVYLAGWSARNDGPAAYSMQCVPPESDQYWRETVADQAKEFGAGNIVEDDPFRLVKLDSLIANPPPAPGLTLEMCGISIDGSPDDVIDAMDPALDLLTVLEMQRRRKVPVRPGELPAHWVGGLALLTSITRGGIAQRVVHRWEEDRAGSLIQPRPIEWKQWRAQRVFSLGQIAMAEAVASFRSVK